MKTAISVPDVTYAKVERCVALLGISRSEFYTTAAQRYLEHLESRELTRQIDEALDLANDDDSAAAAVAAGRRRLALDEEDGW
ncbi:hypothetical protein [Sphaerimonospora thailandensis]|uniref:Antitoxin MazE6 n=1 Tax=Sphaerimonospora thailandensis TaxID=795644 RepID=A0A8J3R863_9ACTN|nr:hypothetical protein [Sphaerimonospora thailandensis]GIH69839.1 antitoxin MazE6 [Sphaerimonospora thailandensis]